MSRLKLAVGSAALSKLPAIAVQGLSFPLILHAVGTVQYAMFFSLTSFLALASLLGSGLFPALSSAIAAAVAQSNQDLERRIVQDATALFAAIALGFLLLGSVVPTSEIRWLINVGPSVTDLELELGYLAALATTSLNIFAAAVSSVRIGYQETHVINLIAFWSNVFVVAAIWAVVLVAPILVAFILVIFVPLNLACIVDFVLLARRRNLFGASTRRFGTAFGEIMRSSWPALVAQWVWYFNSNGTIVLVSHMLGASGSGAFGSLLRPMMIMVGFFAMFFQPAVPSISSAWASADLQWVRSIYRQLAIGTAAMAGFVALVLITIGPWLFRLWLRRDIGIDWTMCALGGGFFFVWMLQLMNYNVLLAINETRGLALVYLSENALVILSGVFLIGRMGPAGMLLGLLLSSLAVTAWVLPLRIFRLVFQDRDRASPDSTITA